MPEQIRIPIPDPLGLLGDLTRDMPVVLFDPLKNAGEMEKSKEESQAREDKGKEDIVEQKIRNYTFHLQEALKFSPCPGCRALIISALVGVEIYKMMEQEGRTREDFTDEEIQRIKQTIEEKYGR